MKVCFVGVGSIAKRHIRNIVELFRNKEDSLVIDAIRRTGTSYCEEQKYLSTIYNNYSEIPSDYDVIFITNPTEYHAETLLALQDKSKHFFIEKPLVSIHTELLIKNFIPKKDSVYYVACPLRYHKVIQYLKENLLIDDVLSLRAICSSYLPDWRPNTDYRETYSAKSLLGGGVSIDLIHEWDYITYLFGFPTSVKMLNGRISPLEIDSDDYAIYIAKFNSMIGEVHLDYFGRKNIRQLEIFTRNETIVGDLVNGTVSFLVSGKNIRLSEDRDEFQKRELNHFFSLLNRKDKTYNDINTALKVLDLSQGRI